MILENAMCLLKIALVTCLVTAGALLIVRWANRGNYISFVSWEEFKGLIGKLKEGEITEGQFNERIERK